jgi:hypothetical protein
MKMIKLKEIEKSNRGAFVIDWDGNIHNIYYHGNVFYESGFEKLMQRAQELVGYSSSTFTSMIKNGENELLSILDNAGCIRGGIWSQSRRQLYFTIDKHKASDKAKMGAIDKIITYRPTLIYVEDLDNERNDNYMQADEFAGEYL